MNEYWFFLCCVYIDGPTGPQGPPGPAGGGALEYAYFYALDQTVTEFQRIVFETGINSGIVIPSPDLTEFTIAQSGVYYIAAAWSQNFADPLLAVVTLNGAKIPHMNYILGFAQISLESVIPGWIILNLSTGDVISITNYAPTTTFVAPANNNPANNPAPNAAATLTFIRLA